MTTIKNIAPSRLHLGKEQSGAPLPLKAWGPGRGHIRAKKTGI